MADKMNPETIMANQLIAIAATSNLYSRFNPYLAAMMIKAENVNAKQRMKMVMIALSSLIDFENMGTSNNKARLIIRYPISSRAIKIP